MSTLAEPDTVPEKAPGPPGDREFPSIFPKTTIIFGAVALLLGALGIAGMYFGIAAFQSIAPGYQTMAFSTAILLILFGGILTAGTLRPFSQRAQTGIQVAMIAVALIGIIELPFNILGSHFFIESQLVGMGNFIAGKPTSPISPATIILVLLTAIGFFLLVTRSTPAGNLRTRDSAGLLGLVVALGGFTFVLSYLYGSPLLYRSSLIPVAAPTALAFLAVGIGLVTAAGTGAVPLRYFAGDSIRAHLLRTFLPLTIAIILAGTALEITRHFFGGMFDAILTAASIVVFCLIMGAVVIRVSGRVSDTLEAATRERKKAEEALQKAHDELEERVQQRTAELEVKNEELGALNEELTATQEELHKNVEELSRKEAILHNLAGQRQLALDAAALGWWHYEPVTRIASYDRRYREIFSVEGEESPNDEILATRMHPDDLPGVWARVERALDPVDPQPYSATYRINLPGGAVKWIEAHGIGLFEGTGNDRHAVSLVGTVADITDRKKAQDELKSKNEDLCELNEELAATQEVLQQNVEDLGRSGEILRQNEERLREALAEKEVLLSEIHHRVKNNLTAFISLLSLEGTVTDTPEGNRLKHDLQNRARSMALIHETLYRTHLYNEVDMDMYLTTLLEQISQSFQTTKSVNTVVDAHGVMLDIPRATPAGLIVNEIVTNSYKYAFPKSFDVRGVRNAPPTISITLTNNDGIYVMSVKDNGVGLPPGFDPLTAKSLGLKLVTFLAKHQMRAEVEMNSENGTEFIFRFKE